MGATYDFESGLGVRDGPATGVAKGVGGDGSAGVTGAMGEDGAVETELD